MTKTLKISSGRGFKYTDEEIISETPTIKITMQCKHVPDSKTGKFHHLELVIKKYVKKSSENWVEAEKSTQINLKTKDKTNLKTENPVKLFLQILEAQRELIFKNLNPTTTLLIDDAKKIDLFKSLSQNDLLEVVSELSTRKDQSVTKGALEILVDKSNVELSEIIKFGFTPNKLEEKREQIKTLEDLIADPNVKEVSDVQKKLAEMPWIFGPEYEKLDRRDAGDEGIPDARLKRIDGLSDILEVKLPNAELVRKDKLNRHYIAPALSEALGQLTGYLEHYLSAYTHLKDDETYEDVRDEFYGKYYKPRGILLIGRRFTKDGTKGVSNTVDATPKVLRKVVSYFHWLEVLTYDDLIERANNALDKFST